MGLMYWENFRTGETDALPSGTIPANLVDYLPQDSEAIALFNLYQKMGMTKEAAYLNVLNRYLGIEGGQNVV